MRLTEYFDKPEYLYQPAQALRRLRRLLTATPDSAEVVLPWGLTMRIKPREDLGRALQILEAAQVEPARGPIRQFALGTLAVKQIGRAIKLQQHAPQRFNLLRQIFAEHLM